MPRGACVLDADACSLNLSRSEARIHHLVHLNDNRSGAGAAAVAAPVLSLLESLHLMAQELVLPRLASLVESHIASRVRTRTYVRTAYKKGFR